MIAGLGLALLGAIAAALIVLSAGRLLLDWAAGLPDRVEGFPETLINTPLSPLLAAADRLAGKSIFDDTRRLIEQRLVLAGRPWGITARAYLAVALLCGAGFALFVMLMLLIAGAGALITLGLAVGSGVLAAWIAVEYLGNVVSERTESLTREFPYFLDLAVMSMESGATFPQAIDIYVREGSLASPLVQELRQTQSEIGMGETLERAILSMESRTQAEAVQSVLRSIVQGYRMGTPLARVLREQAAALRFRRSQWAERAAEELKVKLQGPAMMMMIAVMLLILGPAIVGMLGSNVF